MSAIALGLREGVDCAGLLEYTGLIASAAGCTRDLVNALEGMRMRPTKKILESKLALELGSAHSQFIIATDLLSRSRVHYLTITGEKGIDLLHVRGVSYATGLHHTLDLGLRLQIEPSLGPLFDRECQRAERQLNKFTLALDERHSSLLVLARRGGREQEIDVTRRAALNHASADLVGQKNASMDKAHFVASCTRSFRRRAARRAVCDGGISIEPPRSNGLRTPSVVQCLAPAPGGSSLRFLARGSRYGVAELFAKIVGVVAIAGPEAIAWPSGAPWPAFMALAIASLVVATALAWLKENHRHSEFTMREAHRHLEELTRFIDTNLGTRHKDNT